MNSDVQLTRQRARIACDPCRERKRKCDGSRPCELCASFGYDCSYRSVPRKRRKRDDEPTGSASTQSQLASPVPTCESSSHAPTSVGLASKTRPRDVKAFVRSLEGNSGAAFLRTLALAVDPNNAAPIQLFAWNIFLGEGRRSSSSVPRSITDILSFSEMHQLATFYLHNVDPCYGFIDKRALEKRMLDRWLPGQPVTLYDAILCGVAGLGSLFSHQSSVATENDLAQSAKSILEQHLSEPASVYSATGWVLRTAYLRTTASPDEAWNASCIAMHNIDAAGLHSEINSETLFLRNGGQEECPPDLRRRIFSVAQHLNMWMSFDLGRSRVILQNATAILPSERPGDFTAELLGLLPRSAGMDPDNPAGGDELCSALSEVLVRTPVEPPSVLGHCNLMLCILRRLHTLKWELPSETLNRAFDLIQQSMQSVKQAVQNAIPWHHVANVPFQAICVLLALDTPQSLSLLGEATASLIEVDRVYQTKATKDAVATVRLLILMHQRRREADLERQGRMLKLYPAIAFPPVDYGMESSAADETFGDLTWLDEFPEGIDFAGLFT